MSEEQGSPYRSANGAGSREVGGVGQAKAGTAEVHDAVAGAAGESAGPARRVPDIGVPLSQRDADAGPESGLAARHSVRPALAGAGRHGASCLS